MSKVALRQLFNGGLLGQLAAAPADAAASSGTNIMEEMAMNVSQRNYLNILTPILPQMAQQQIEQMLSSGELENMAMEFMSSGQMEQIVQDFMADPATEQMMNECVLFALKSQLMKNLFSMMAELMRPPTEEEAAMMMSMMEELMKPPTEEEMAEMEQGKDAQINIILQLSYTFMLVSS